MATGSAASRRSALAQASGTAGRSTVNIAQHVLHEQGAVDPYAKQSMVVGPCSAAFERAQRFRCTGQAYEATHFPETRRRSPRSTVMERKLSIAVTEAS